MKRTRFTDEQTISILSEHEAGAKCAELCRKHGMSEGTFYNSKARFGDITVSEAKRLKGLEDVYQKVLREHGLKVSMSGKGKCYDNAAVETFFKTIKVKLIWRHACETHRQAETVIF